MVEQKIAIILARGGSKRLPRKNILPLGGKPMIAWSIEAALGSCQFDRVLVSTDDEEIADISRACGAEVPFLRTTAADDLSSSSNATLAALSQAEEYWGERFDVVAQLMANCPLRDLDDIREAMSNFYFREADSQISCFRFGWMNPWWAMKLDSQGRAHVMHPDAMSARSQDLPPLYCPTGALWIARTAVLKANTTFYTPKHIFHPLNWISAMDIDDAEDLQMAKVCFHLRHSASG